MPSASQGQPQQTNGLLQRRVQAYVQVHACELPAAAAIAAHLGADLEKVQTALDALVGDGALVRRAGAETTYAPTSTQKRLGQVLIGRGLVTKHAMGEALGAQRGNPYVNLVTTPIDDHLLRSIPLSVITELRAASFARVGQEVHVAMPDPSDVMAIDRLSGLMRARVRPFFTTERDFEWLLSTRFNVTQAVREGATDIHIEPQADGTAVRYRIDGLL